MGGGVEREAEHGAAAPEGVASEPPKQPLPAELPDTHNVKPLIAKALQAQANAAMCNVAFYMWCPQRHPLSEVLSGKASCAKCHRDSEEKHYACKECSFALCEECALPKPPSCSRKGCHCDAHDQTSPSECCITCHRGEACKRAVHMHIYLCAAEDWTIRCMTCLAAPANKDHQQCQNCYDLECIEKKFEKWDSNELVRELINTDFVAYHGTSITAASDIVRLRDLHPSTDGELGAGTYVACLDKATNFAIDAEKRGRGRGKAIVKILVRCRRTFVCDSQQEASSTDWRGQGYDSCMVGHTSQSLRPEMCVTDATNLIVLGWKKLFL